MQSPFLRVLPGIVYLQRDVLGLLASHIFCEDAALIQPKINGALQPFFEGQFSWMRDTGIIQHKRIELVASLKTTYLAPSVMI